MKSLVRPLISDKNTVHMLYLEVMNLNHSEIVQRLASDLESQAAGKVSRLINSQYTIEKFT